MNRQNITASSHALAILSLVMVSLLAMAYFVDNSTSPFELGNRTIIPHFESSYMELVMFLAGAMSGCALMIVLMEGKK
jgi:hypothetical protein